MLIDKFKYWLHFSAVFIVIKFEPTNATLYNNTLGATFFQHVQTLSPQEFNSPTKECVVEIIRKFNSSNLAFQFSDSWGNIPSGLNEGNHLSYGSFDECLSIGKYCIANLPVSALMESSQIQRPVLSIGICFPSICTSSSMNTLLAQFLREQSTVPVQNENFVNDFSCSVRETEPIPFFAWLTLSIFLLFVLICLLCSFYHFQYKKSEKSLNRYLIAFSLYYNSHQLFHIVENTPKMIPCINGIRVLSTIWIVYGHGYMMTFMADNALNANHITNWLKQFYAMLWHNFALAVDTFLYMSGFLLALSTFTELDKNKGRLNIMTMYLYRYIRLTNILLSAILFFITWFYLLGSGPQWEKYTSNTQYCSTNWWIYLLYLQNYVLVEEICLGHIWYLAADMQLFLISPALIYVIWRFQRRGMYAVTALTLSLIIAHFCIIYFQDFVIFYPEGNRAEITPGWKYFYLPTHTRTSGWFIGILFAYFLHNKNGKNPNLSMLFIIVGWLMTAAVMLSIVFGLYSHVYTVTPLTTLENASYGSLSRVGWPLGLCWIIYACIHGYAGWVDSILSWKFWQPLSKLSYSIYIWHYIINTMIERQQRNNTYFSDFQVMVSFLGVLFITILVSICTYLIIEGPFNNLGQMLRQRKPKN